LINQRFRYLSLKLYDDMIAKKWFIERRRVSSPDRQIHQPHFRLLSYNMSNSNDMNDLASLLGQDTARDGVVVRDVYSTNGVVKMDPVP